MLTRDAPTWRMSLAAAKRRARTARPRAFLRVRRRRALIRFRFARGCNSTDFHKTISSAKSADNDSCDVTRDGDVAMPSPGMPSGSGDTTPSRGVKGVSVDCSGGGPRALSSGGESGGTEGHEKRVIDQMDAHNSPAPQLSPYGTGVVSMPVGEKVDFETNGTSHISAKSHQPAGACPPPEGAAFTGWARRRKKKLGHCDAHARFLQHLFRGYRRLRPDGWRRGGLAGCPMPYRPCTVFRCRGGRCGATDSDFEVQRQRAEEVLEWYSIYPDLLGRLSNRRPRTYHPYCAAGADAVGVQRMRGVPFG